MRPTVDSWFRNPGSTHQLRLVAEIPLFTTSFSTSQVVVWDVIHQQYVQINQVVLYYRSR